MFALFFFSVEPTTRSALADKVSGGEREIEVGGPLSGHHGLFVASRMRQILYAASLPFRIYISTFHLKHKLFLRRPARADEVKAVKQIVLKEDRRGQNEKNCHGLIALRRGPL